MLDLLLLRSFRDNTHSFYQFLVIMNVLLYLWCILFLVDAKCCNGRSSTTISVRLDVKSIKTDREHLLPVHSVSASNDIGKTEVRRHSYQKMSITSLVVNIVADLCPHGMMPLAFGLAHGGTTGWITATLLLVLFGGMSTYTMISYAEMASVTNAKSIGDLWKILINERSQWVVDGSIFALCLGCCVFYSAFIGDIFTSLVSALGVRGYFAERWVVLLFITSLVLLPLCGLEDMSALQFSSSIGAAGILYTVAFHVIRLLDHTYQDGSNMLSFLPPKMQPSWPDPKLQPWKVSSGTLVLMNMLCVAFLAHYNSINYAEELDNPTAARYRTAVSAGFGVSMLVFLTMMMAGYHLFGTTAQPLVLNNFPLTADKLAIVARAATGVAITFGYPLMFSGLKSSLFSLIDTFSASKTTENMKTQQKRPRWNPLSTPASVHSSPVDVKEKTAVERLSPTIKYLAIQVTSAVIMGIAMKCSEEDVSVVLGIVGSVLGCFVAYILPGLLKIALQRQRTQFGLQNSAVDVLMNHAIVALGVLFGGLGVWVTWKSEVDRLKYGGHHH